MVRIQIYFLFNDFKTKSDLMSLTRLAGLDDIFYTPLRLFSWLSSDHVAHRLVFTGTTYLALGMDIAT